MEVLPLPRPKKYTRWHILLFDKNVFLVALNVKANLTNSKHSQFTNNTSSLKTL